MTGMLLRAGLGNGTTGNTGDINFTNNAPCTWNQYELDISGDNVNGSPANYKARISVYWEPNGGTDAGSINGDQQFVQVMILHC